MITGNQFASVEQGRSYVLSVNSPTGAGEIELLAADSDQQFEVEKKGERMRRESRKKKDVDERKK